MVILYTIAPVLYRMASSVYFNLSLLTADFYGLLFGECPYFADGREAAAELNDRDILFQDCSFMWVSAAF